MDASKRLKRALAHARRQDPRWSLHAVHKELHERGVRGSSWGSVRNYFHGKSEPPLEFLLATAELLGVRPEWLSAGDGPMTAEETAVAAAEAATEQEADWGAAVLSILEDGFPLFPELPRWTRAVILEAVRRLSVRRVLGFADLDYDDMEMELPLSTIDVAFGVAQVLHDSHAGLEHLGLHSLSEEQTAAFVADVARALMHLTQEES